MDLGAGDSNEEEEEEDADEPMTADDLEFLDGSHVDEGNLHNQFNLRAQFKSDFHISAPVD